MASKAKKAPAIKPLDRPAIETSLTKLAFVGDVARVRELLDPPEGKATSDVAEKDVYVRGCQSLPCASSLVLPFPHLAVAVSRVCSITLCWTSVHAPCVCDGCPRASWPEPVAVCCCCVVFLLSRVCTSWLSRPSSNRLWLASSPSRCGSCSGVTHEAVIGGVVLISVSFRRFGCTALTWASRNGKLDVLKVLLAKEGDVESVSYGGFKPIHHACNASEEGTVKELLAAGCNVSSLDDAGNTAMHWAAARCVSNVVLQW